MPCFPQSFHHSQCTLWLYVFLWISCSASNICESMILGKVFKMCTAVLWSYIRHNWLWYSVAAKCFIQSCNNCIGRGNTKVDYHNVAWKVINNKKVSLLLRKEKVCLAPLSSARALCPVLWTYATVLHQLTDVYRQTLPLDWLASFCPELENTLVTTAVMEDFLFHHNYNSLTSEKKLSSQGEVFPFWPIYDHSSGGRACFSSHWIW